MNIRRIEAAVARRQAEWIVAMEPWLSMGYRAVFQPDFLLGTFIALLAVRPQAAGQGVGRALVERIERDTFVRRRWFYVSSDNKNLPAARFYKKLGFERVARLPDLVCEDRVEILWRKGRL